MVWRVSELPNFLLTHIISRKIKFLAQFALKLLLDILLEHSPAFFKCFCSALPSLFYTICWVEFCARNAPWYWCLPWNMSSKLVPTIYFFLQLVLSYSGTFCPCRMHATSKADSLTTTGATVIAYHTIHPTPTGGIPHTQVTDWQQYIATIYSHYVFWYITAILTVCWYINSYWSFSIQTQLWTRCVCITDFLLCNNMQLYVPSTPTRHRHRKQIRSVQVMHCHAN